MNKYKVGDIITVRGIELDREDGSITESSHTVLNVEPTDSGIYRYLFLESTGRWVEVPEKFIVR